MRGAPGRMLESNVQAEIPKVLKAKGQLTADLHPMRTPCWELWKGREKPEQVVGRGCRPRKAQRKRPEDWARPGQGGPCGARGSAAKPQGDPEPGPRETGADATALAGEDHGANN